MCRCVYVCVLLSILLFRSAVILFSCISPPDAVSESCSEDIKQMLKRKGVDSGAKMTLEHKR